MKFCDRHWQALRDAIERRGLSHLVANGGEAAHRNMVAELSGEEHQHDPLMACHNMIASRAVEAGGLYLMFQKEDGTDYCPICEAVSNGAGTEEWWIDGPADAELAYCRQKALVPNVQ